MFEITPFSMRPIYHDPFQEIEKLERDFFANKAHGSFNTDIRDIGESYLIEADLPGFNKEDIHVDIKNSRLTISAERHSEIEKKDDKGNVIHSERSFGSFTRSFDLSGVEEEGISAGYKDGVLTLTLPKKKEVTPESRRLEIQ